MIAGGFVPDWADLKAIYQTEETRQHARDWLSERADYRDAWDSWKSARDLILEIAVILLILAEIVLSAIFGIIAIRDDSSILIVAIAGLRSGQVPRPSEPNE